MTTCWYFLYKFSLYNVKINTIYIKYVMECNINVFDLTIMGLNCKLFKDGLYMMLIGATATWFFLRLHSCHIFVKM